MPNILNGKNSFSKGIKVEYQGKYSVFDSEYIKTYSVLSRKNKCSVKDFIDCDRLAGKPIISPGEEAEQVGAAIADAYRNNLPLIVLTGAHPIKNGLSPIYLDWMKRGVLKLLGTNGAGTIHDFEFASLGESSEDVRGVLANGEFGMSFETCTYLNQALIEGNAGKLGYGESIGRLYCDREFRKTVLDAVFSTVSPPEGRVLKPYDGFEYVDYSVAATAYRQEVPFTVHVGIGTDILDQHCNFDGEAKGGTSGRDFLIFVDMIAGLTEGGVILNVGTAVTGPEVLLKAVSMAANIGKAPKGITVADFDIRPFVFDDKARDESKYYYYFRDQKSVVTRIPSVFGGKGYYLEGDHSITLTTVYQYFRKHLGD